MKKDLKDEILQTAKHLFNRRGYRQVSMRNIADALGISVGNLTYYYKRKEDLVEAVIVHQHKTLHRRPAPETLAELDAFFTGMLRHQKENEYYFRNYTELAHLSQSVYELQRNMLHGLYHKIADGLENLHAAGMIQEDEIAHQRHLTLHALMNVCIFGTALEQRHRRATLWCLVYPLLSEKGRTVYRAEIEPGLTKN